MTGIGRTGAARFHLMLCRSELSLDDPLLSVANDRFGDIYFAPAISAFTAAGKSFGTGTPAAA